MTLSLLHHKLYSIVLGALCLIYTPYLTGQRSAEQKIKQYASIPEEQQIDSLINYYATLSRISDAETAKRYADGLKSHFKKRNLHLGLWKLLNHQMLVASDEGNYEKAQYLKLKLLEIDGALLPEDIKIQQYLNFGYLEFFVGKYDLAIDIWKSGLEACKNSELPLLQYQLYSNIGSAYFSKSYLRTASRYYLKALEWAEKEQISHLDLYNNLAAVSIKSRDLKSAHQYLNRIVLDSVQDDYLRLEIQTNRMKTALLTKDTITARKLYPWLEAHIDDFPPIRSFVIGSLLEYNLLYQPNKLKLFAQKYPEIHHVSEGNLSEILPIWNTYHPYIAQLPATYINDIENQKPSILEIREQVSLFLAFANKDVQYWERYEIIRRERLENLDSLLIQDLSANLRALKLEYERAELQSSVQRMEFERIVAGGISLLILALLSIIIVQQRRANHKKELEQRLSQELIDSQSTLISYSESIVQKAHVWLEEIQTISNFSESAEVKKRLQALKRDFSILGKVTERQHIREEESANQPILEHKELEILNKTELRVAQYIMRGMRTKEIGTFMELSPVYINNVRYRIRKKLKIPKDVLVEDYLQGLNSGTKD